MIASLLFILKTGLLNCRELQCTCLSVMECLTSEQ